MAYYAEVVNLTRSTPHVIMVHFELRDDTSDPDTLVMQGTLGFQVFIRDSTGDIIAKTLTEKRQRLRTTYDAYIDNLIQTVGQIDAHFAGLLSQAIGYRYPAAG